MNIYLFSEPSFPILRRQLDDFLTELTLALIRNRRTHARARVREPIPLFRTKSTDRRG